MHLNQEILDTLRKAFEKSVPVYRRKSDGRIQYTINEADANDWEFVSIIPDPPGHVVDAILGTGTPEPSEDAKQILNTPPDKIYLQVGDVDSEFPGEIHWREVTWCTDQIEPTDLVYVRQKPVVKESLITGPLVRLTDEEIRRHAIEEQFILFCDMDEFEQIANHIQDAFVAKNGGLN